ncbi:MAG: DUF3658 domain-containing protein, partial [Erysipelotrichaceae bacterium]
GDTHIFINEDEMTNIDHKITLTNINGNYYFTTFDALKQSDIFIIDPIGATELLNTVTQLNYIIYYFDASYDQRLKMVNKRCDNNIKELSIFKERCINEDKQFTDFEQLIFNKKLSSKNLLKINIIDVNYSEKQVNEIIDTIVDNDYQHIVFCEPFYYVLKQHFTNIIYNFDDLSLGYIDDDINSREEWFKKITADAYQIDEMTIDYYQANNYKELDLNKKTIIWVGNNVIEQCALCQLLTKYVFKDIYIVNREDYISSALYEIKDIKYKKSIDNSFIDNYQKTYRQLINDNKTLRVLKNHEIISVDDDYYDELLCNNFKKYQNINKAIGLTMGESGQIIGDNFLKQRFFLKINKKYLK